MTDLTVDQLCLCAIGTVPTVHASIYFPVPVRLYLHVSSTGGTDISIVYLLYWWYSHLCSLSTGGTHISIVYLLVVLTSLQSIWSVYLSAGSTHISIVSQSIWSVYLSSGGNHISIVYLVSTSIYWWYSHLHNYDFTILFYVYNLHSTST